MQSDRQAKSVSLVFMIEIDAAERTGMVSSSFKPILRKPRSQWRIPLLKSPCKRQSPAQVSALISGTTPLGREILRKLFFGLERRLEANEEPLPQLVEFVEAQLKTFWVLQPEFALLLSRLWGGDHQGWVAATPRQLATLLVLGTSCTVQLQRSRLDDLEPTNSPA